MAEFSKEYIDSLSLQMIPDFSYLEEFPNLKRNSSIKIICEGFGSIGMENRNGECYLMFLDKEQQPILLTTIIQNLKNKKQNV